jgi:hypothetical protein
MKTHETCSLNWTGAESKSGWEELGDGVWKVSPQLPSTDQQGGYAQAQFMQRVEGPVWSKNGNLSGGLNYSG